MAEEKIFTINLRREFSKNPLYKRTKKSIAAVREFISKHLKVEEVKIGKNLNMHLWKRGKRNPPPKVKVNAYVEDKTAYVELEGYKFEKPQQKEEEKKTIAEKILGKKEETVKTKEEATKEKEEEHKKEEKEEIRELQKEEKAKQKKEHTPEVMEKPGKGLKQREKVKTKLDKYSGVIPETGKKDAKEPKP